MKYNLAVFNSNVVAICNFLLGCVENADCTPAIEKLSVDSGFPYISARLVVDAFAASGVNIKAKLCGPDELGRLNFPLLAVMNRFGSDNQDLEILILHEIGPDNVIIADHRNSIIHLERSKFSVSFKNIVFELVIRTRRMGPATPA